MLSLAPDGIPEFTLKRGLVGVGVKRVDFAYFNDVEKCWQFYEIKPDHTWAVKAGQKQLEEYIRVAAEGGERPTKGTTVLPALNGVTLWDLYLGHGLHADIALRTYPGDPNHAGMIYYELINQRIDVKEMAREAAVLLGVLLGEWLLQNVPLPTPIPAPVPAF